MAKVAEAHTSGRWVKEEARFQLYRDRREKFAKTRCLVLEDESSEAVNALLAQHIESSAPSTTSSEFNGRVPAGQQFDALLHAAQPDLPRLSGGARSGQRLAVPGDDDLFPTFDCADEFGQPVLGFSDADFQSRGGYVSPKTCISPVLYRPPRRSTRP